MWEESFYLCFSWLLFSKHRDTLNIFFCRFLSLQRNVSLALFVLSISFSLSLFSISGFANAGASEAQRLDFVQGFYYKNKGRGRVVHTREGREIWKNKSRRKNKVQNIHAQQLLLRQRDIPRGQGAAMPAPKYIQWPQRYFKNNIPDSWSVNNTSYHTTLGNNTSPSLRIIPE